ncbi:gliding motility-associated C-terminal domain-containing protein [Maribacter sedimenticola]|uniref:Gliding motility-associated C-terminal domain-containing protein n=1 Tax=Maribacter sedimenticola TaxID=228956 RepID=A0ABY1SDA4_9FLAO|nr:gliding motility-associated C-terminal domain-containing protein [Maribacter sedimenticola]SNR26774.1 gliding motility-associated C-terminal domain-containing protein [Maribacter sedimenticola]
MKILPLFTLYILFLQYTYAQNIRNIGDLKIHEKGQIGFYSNLKNDGNFNNTNGLAGFYGLNLNTIYGTTPLSFHDIEINNDQGVLLQVPVQVNHNINFIYGDFISSKSTSSPDLSLTTDSFYNGESNFSKVNGFVSVYGQQNFLFPIGDEFYLRPLGLKTNSTTTTYKSAYLFENSTWYYPFIDQGQTGIAQISENEYWVLEGNDSAIITISWDERSAISMMTNNLDNLTIVGFNKELNLWQSLGALDRTGTLDQGIITSYEFVPDHYSAITFGITPGNTAISHKGYHYLVTPNGDGINDFLFIPELAEFKTNRLLIFDRNGLKVFEQENYTNEFFGEAGFTIPAISRTKGLPEGIYFYLVEVGEEKFTIQGFLFLDR